MARTPSANDGGQYCRYAFDDYDGSLDFFRPPLVVGGSGRYETRLALTDY